MLWLGICFPRLALEVFLRGACLDADPASIPQAAVESAPRVDTPAPPNPLLAVCDRLTVLQATPAAQALGLRPGLKRATALSLAPHLRIVERDALREREALAQVATWALQFTPSVACVESLAQGAPPSSALTLPGDSPSGIVMEIEPSLRLFGGLDALLARVREGLAHQGFSAQIGLAPTATGAWLLGRHADGSRAGSLAELNARLAELPAWLLDAARPHWPTLESIGARTLQDLTRLPRAGLARRFGKGMLQEFDRALGREPDPRIWHEAPAEFDARVELLAQVEQADALLFVARRLLLQVAGWLQALHRATREIELRIEHDDRPATVLVLRTSEPTRDPERLTILLREQLARLTLPEPAHTLGMQCRETVPLSPPNDELFPVPASARESLGRLIERLQTRLGRHQVQRLLIAEDHRPEAAYRIDVIDDLSPLAPVAGTGTARYPRHRTDPPSGRSGHTHTLPRPLWLLRAPIALSERNHRPYWHSPLALLAGPERIESGWWDGRLIQRDYFIAEDEAHALYWIYRERLPDTDSGQGWFVQGRFG
jgi:protein ImuB